MLYISFLLPRTDFFDEEICGSITDAENALRNQFYVKTTTTQKVKCHSFEKKNYFKGARKMIKMLYENRGVASKIKVCFLFSSFKVCSR